MVGISVRRGHFVRLVAIAAGANTFRLCGSVARTLAFLSVLLSAAAARATALLVANFGAEVSPVSKAALSNWWTIIYGLFVAGPLIASYMKRLGRSRCHRMAWIAAMLGIVGGVARFLFVSVPSSPLAVW
jgi:hypothetical protein